MHDLIAELLREHPELRFRALGAAPNRAALDLAPYGHPIEFLDAAAHRDWVDRYHRANLARFPGPLTLPGWVLVDLYLMPAAVGLLTCPARYLDVRPPGLGDDDEGVAAAYYAAPGITPGTVVGVSLISLREGFGNAALIKAMTLKMLRARVQRGIAQWSNRSLRVHTRFGPLRLEGFVPGPHGKENESFLYTVDLTDDAALAEHMKRRHEADPDAPEGARWYDVEDLGSLGEILRRAASGARIEILPPGLSADGKRVLVRHG